MAKKQVGYDGKLANKIFDELEGDFEVRARKLARIYGIEQEIEPLLLNYGPYRGHSDLDSIMQKAIENKETGSLESLIGEPKAVSGIRIFYEMIKDIGRYAIFGALPASIQEKIAKKNNEIAIDYTILSSRSEFIASLILAGTLGYEFGNSLVVLFSVIAFPCFELLSSVERHNEAKTLGKACGSPLVAIIYYPIKYLKDGYQTKKRKLNKKNELKYRIETEGVKQLPFPQVSEDLVEIDSEGKITKFEALKK